MKRWIAPTVAGMLFALMAAIFLADRLPRKALRGGDRWLVQVDILKISVAGSPPTGVVIVVPRGGERSVVPLFVPPLEARAIEDRSHSPRAAPLLAQATLTTLGAKLDRVILGGKNGDPTEGRAEIERGGRVRAVVGETGALLEWAIAAHASVWITRELLTSEGLTSRQIQELEPEAPDAPEAPGVPSL